MTNGTTAVRPVSQRHNVALNQPNQFLLQALELWNYFCFYKNGEQSNVKKKINH